ncbi:penM MFS-type transporter penM [Candida maltosa Xu316]|uniref:Polyamine transporter, putative n=1 Tax=Candida maltosa (strain Xu316) TaxID=1245528 RepID=M3JV07_CANMX|nr:Polyamine transporter, putative [Candida maltosa Xu316]
MSKEKQSFDEKFHDVSTSSTHDSNEVLEFTCSNYENQNRSRKNSTSRKSLEVIKKRIIGDSGFETGSEIQDYTVDHIYPDLTNAEIELQRTQTRNTILTKLESQVDDDEKYTETVQDTNVPIAHHGTDFTKIDPELITWNGSEDPEDPRNWPINTKIYLLGFVSLYALVAPMSSSMLSPAMSFISEDFNISSSTVQSMVVSIQILGWAFGPLLIAPLSEHDYIGRKLVLDVSCWMSLFFNLGCSFATNTCQMMIFRFVGGLFGCVPMNVCAGVISDMFDAKSRNVALAGYSLVPLLGPVIAPVISGFIVDHKQWRWTFYVLCMFNGFVAISATFLFKETYSPTLLKRKAKKLRKETGNSNLHTIYEVADGETKLGKIIVCATRPVKLLVTNPMIIGLGSFMAFTYGFMYLLIVTYPRIFMDQYHFSKSVNGLMYIPLGVGFGLGVFVWTYAIGKVYDNLTAKNNGVGKPEFRLPCLIVSAFFVPVGLIWFGWSAQYKLHWIMPGIGSAIFAMGLVCVFQSIQNYLIDMNVKFAASSVAAAALFRSLFGFSFPLFANQMYDGLGYGWANTMCAFIAILLGIPFPILCYMHGERIREWANKKMEADQIRRDKRNLEKLRKKNLGDNIV